MIAKVLRLNKAGTPIAWLCLAKLAGNSDSGCKRPGDMESWGDRLHDLWWH